MADLYALGSGGLFSNQNWPHVRSDLLPQVSIKMSATGLGKQIVQSEEDQEKMPD
jgi:hypothetical protein